MCYFALLFLLCLGTMGFGQSIAPRPNVVLVMADDQGWGDMAYNGHATLQTPNFDSAAAAGLRFDRFYAAAPVCSPTRASVLTGRPPESEWSASMGASAATTGSYAGRTDAPGRLCNGTFW